MKGISKNLMAVGLASIMLGGVVGLVGCSAIERDRTEVQDKQIWQKDSYIVVTENGVETLHKGMVYTKEFDKWTTSPMFLKFNCGKELQTSQYVAYSQTRPDAIKYDVVCECAHE